jgi:glycosyltransferase involved in cell wall biosynthesis
MKLIIDLQALQTASAKRGIGRYSVGLCKALLDEFKDWEVFFLLHDEVGSCLTKRGLEESFSNFSGSTLRFPLPSLDSPALHIHADQLRMSKILRERIIEGVAPDVVLIASLFEVDGVSTVPPVSSRSYACGVILYDLIPLEDPDGYLPNVIIKDWYFERIGQLKNADFMLSISDYVRVDAISKLSLDAEVVVNISAGVDLDISLGDKSADDALFLRNVADPYLLYVGGFDVRKNIEKFIYCFSLLSNELKRRFRIVLAGSISAQRRDEIENYVKNIDEVDIRVDILGYVDDENLVRLYKGAHLFVFPSLNEGFGLPPLEAMRLGVPTIASNRSSLPEVVGNSAALFDPDNIHDFVRVLELGIQDEQFRENLIDTGIIQSSRFSWVKTAGVAAEIIKKSVGENSNAGSRASQNFQGFVSEHYLSGNFSPESFRDKKFKNLVARGLWCASEAKNAVESEFLARELIVGRNFQDEIPAYVHAEKPQVFSSVLCREQHFHLPLYSYWCKKIKEVPRLHRKQWEFVYICQVLYERGALRPGASAIGFGVGKEPLVSLFASFGLQVMATDLDFHRAVEAGWVATNQHSDSLENLNKKQICPTADFERLVQFRSVDMNTIPDDIGKYDICWSSCAFEHLGSIRKGLDFVIKSSELLKPGGIAVHTTEYNVISNERTLDDNPDFVLFRKCDIEQLGRELASKGYILETVDFCSGNDSLEAHVDMPPYTKEPHLRLQLAGEYVATSLGLIIRSPNEV